MQSEQALMFKSLVSAVQNIGTTLQCLNSTVSQLVTEKRQRESTPFCCIHNGGLSEQQLHAVLQYRCVPADCGGGVPISREQASECILSTDGPNGVANAATHSTAPPLDTNTGFLLEAHPTTVDNPASGFPSTSTALALEPVLPVTIKEEVIYDETEEDPPELNNGFEHLEEETEESDEEEDWTLELEYEDDDVDNGDESGPPAEENSPSTSKLNVEENTANDDNGILVSASPSSTSPVKRKPKLRSSSSGRKEGSPNRKHLSPSSGKGSRRQSARRASANLQDTFFARRKRIALTEACKGAPKRASDQAERPHACSECGKAFVLRGNLNQHMKLHTGLKPYLCKICGASFAQKGGLKSHVRVHLGNAPYSCNCCEAHFKREWDLKKHMAKQHAGQTRWVCQQCSLSFTLRVSFLRHLRKHARHENYKAMTAKKLLANVF